MFGMSPRYRANDDAGRSIDAMLLRVSRSAASVPAPHMSGTRDRGVAEAGPGSVIERPLDLAPVFVVVPQRES